jgi:hypothetical protein
VKYVVMSDITSGGIPFRVAWGGGAASAVAVVPFITLLPLEGAIYSERLVGGVDVLFVVEDSAPHAARI